MAMGWGAPFVPGNFISEQTVTSLKVTIQQSSDSREFRQMDESDSQVVCTVMSVTSPVALCRGRRPNIQRWCDTCQAHFSSDVITHRQTREHKECKKQSRPFCPVCHRHFKTPRKFVEHMKSEKHKQQVHLQEQQEEELITVDAIGCFKEEEEPEEGRHQLLTLDQFSHQGPSAHKTTCCPPHRPSQESRHTCQSQRHR
ncbi:hypothetical protein fugu_004076 [Takifugu bimaculatus]|uniref:C2H2-type domain-containing protein n=1 Tax=Takifugu bimaculatus TaxID=433685 RepID=A0A4Z2BCH5_9TELE|nr:hypothetical protein fugu_004076 [Takifugu bimaculatus]